MIKSTTQSRCAHQRIDGDNSMVACDPVRCSSSSTPLARLSLHEALSSKASRGSDRSCTANAALLQQFADSACCASVVVCSRTYAASRKCGSAMWRSHSPQTTAQAIITGSPASTPRVPPGCVCCPGPFLFPTPSLAQVAAYFGQLCRSAYDKGGVYEPRPLLPPLHRLRLEETHAAGK